LKDDGRLASADNGPGQIKLWPKGFKGEPEVFSHRYRVTALAELRDNRLASAGEDGQIKLWLVAESKLIAALCLRAGRNLSDEDWDRYVGHDPDIPKQQCSAFGLHSNWR